MACKKVQSSEYGADLVSGAQRMPSGFTPNGSGREAQGPRDSFCAGKPYMLVSRDAKKEGTIIRFDGSDGCFGGRGLGIIAGPCSIESEEQAFTIAERVSRAGARFFRGGAYKPRTSPYSFQGMGEEALKIMTEVRERYGLRIVTEALDYESLDLVAEYADVVQIGARSMQNFSLLRRAGRLRKPVLLKRGMSATLEEFLMAAEYVLIEGNHEVILCERGVRTFSDYTRNTLDLSLVPAVHKLSHLPIVVDPSHSTGKRDQVLPMSRAAVASGADGLLIEVHHDPDRALSDGAQSIPCDEFDELVPEIRKIAAVLGREVQEPASRVAAAAATVAG